MRKVTVLGGGMVGSAITRDLARDFEVTLVDRREETRAEFSREQNIAVKVADIAQSDSLNDVTRDADIVVGALPSHLGYNTLKLLIQAGKDCCDISFMAEDALDLDDLARQRGVTCVFDCGVAPGLSNMLAGYGYNQLDSCEQIAIYVGGLPVERRLPFEYKAGFAPADVIEEYTRPAVVIEHGKRVTKEALSEPELIDFDQVGTLEAFNTDGLRSLAKTLPDVPFMKEKTLRYPGHIALMRAFRETGLFRKDEIVVGDQRVIPLEVTSALLFPKWQFEPNEPDFTVMRVIAEGQQNGRPKRYCWELFDRYDAQTGLRSMSRVTAFPAAIMARLILNRKKEIGPGVHAPEILAQQPGLLDHMLTELRKMGTLFELVT